MNIPSLQTSLEATLEHYKDALMRYDDAQFYFEPAGGGWSLGQMYEHVTASGLYYFPKRIGYILESRNGQVGGELTDIGRQVLAAGSFPDARLQIPEALRGPEPVARTRSEYAELLDGIAETARRLAPLAAANAGTYKIYHPPMGFLSAAEWYQLLEMHTRHHLRQQQRLETAYATEPG